MWGRTRISLNFGPFLRRTQDYQRLASTSGGRQLDPQKKHAGLSGTCVPPMPLTLSLALSLPLKLPPTPRKPGMFFFEGNFNFHLATSHDPKFSVKGFQVRIYTTVSGMMSPRGWQSKISMHRGCGQLICERFVAKTAAAVCTTYNSCGHKTERRCLPLCGVFTHVSIFLEHKV